MPKKEKQTKGYWAAKGTRLGQKEQARDCMPL